MLRSFKLLAFLSKGHEGKELAEERGLGGVGGEDPGQCSTAGGLEGFTMRRAPFWSLLEAGTIPNAGFPRAAHEAACAPGEAALSNSRSTNPSFGRFLCVCTLGCREARRPTSDMVPAVRWHAAD